MSLNHGLSDMVASIRNGQQAGLKSVSVHYAKLKASVLDVLKSEGYIAGWEKTLNENEGFVRIKIDLAYSAIGGAIQEIKIISKPGKRVYKSFKDLPTIRNGLGISVLSTSKGVMADQKARELSVGGEFLLTVY